MFNDSMSTLQRTPTDQVVVWRSVLPLVTSAARDDAERMRLLGELESLKSAVAAAQAEVTAAFAVSQREASTRSPEARARGGHRDRVDVVAHSIKAQVALARRLSPAEAGRAVGLARVLVDEMPHTLAALRAGQMSERRAIIIARETAVLSREHRVLIDRALCADPSVIAGWGDRRLAREAAALGYSLDAAAAVNRRRLAETQRTVTLRPAPDQMTWLSALLPLRDGVAAWKALTQAADESRAAGDTRGRGQIMADTLTARVLTGAVHDLTGGCVHVPDAAGAPAGQPARGWHDEPRFAPTPPPVPVRLNLVMTDQSLLSPGGVGWLEGEPFSAADLGELLRGASVQVRRLFADPAGRLVAMESQTRCFPDGLGELIRLRDRSCRTPWCDAPIRQTDLVAPHGGGGTTSYRNGQGLCTACNHAKAAGGWVTLMPEELLDVHSHARSPLPRRTAARRRKRGRAKPDAGFGVVHRTPHAVIVTPLGLPYRGPAEPTPGTLRC